MKNKNKVIVNEDFFEKIDDEIKAYLLGFFAADGCVHNKFGYIMLSVSVKDNYICELFKKYISPETEIKYSHNTKGTVNRQPQCTININSKKIVIDLSQFGIVPRKTFNEFSMKLVPIELKHHFIRGYFDGDGSCYYGRSKNRNKVCVNFTNSTKGILEEIKEYFKDIINFKLETKISKTNKIYYVLAIYNKPEILKFWKFTYKDAIFYFQRKYEKFNYINTVLNSKIKKIELV